MLDGWQGPRSSPRTRKLSTWRRRAVRWVGKEMNYAGEGMYEPDCDGGKADVPDLRV